MQYMCIDRNVWYFKKSLIVCSITQIIILSREIGLWSDVVS